MVDYKATSKEGSIKELGDSPWEAQYARQLGVYRWLLEQNGFKVLPTGYFVYANAQKSSAGFNNELIFETTVVSCETEVSWIKDTLTAIKTCLESDTIPLSGRSCEYCPYREAAGKKLLALHTKNKQANV